MILQPHVSYALHREEIELQCNCSAISETWVNVTLTAEQLGEMLAAILHARGNTTSDSFAVLRALCKDYGK